MRTNRDIIVHATGKKCTVTRILLCREGSRSLLSRGFRFLSIFDCCGASST